MDALEGRRIAVAGAGGSLGPHVVRALKARGAWVAAGDVREEALRELDVDDATVIDLSTQAGASRWADAIGGVDGLLHLVGGWRGGAPLEDTSPEDLAWLEGLLYRTVVHATRAFAPHIKAAGARGRFAIVSSTAAAKPSPGNAGYAAAKAAAEAWTLAFGAELAEHGATANVVVVTALTTEPHPTFTPVEHVADALAWLCTDAAQKMNGQRLHLHG